jgi:hypothetical protein
VQACADPARALGAMALRHLALRCGEEHDELVVAADRERFERRYDALRPGPRGAVARPSM